MLRFISLCWYLNTQISYVFVVMCFDGELQEIYKLWS